VSGDHRWLVLRLEGPLAAFGGVTIDAVGVTRDYPAASMLTGLLANALGWSRRDSEAHRALQNRLIFGARRERENPLGILTDTQNVQLDDDEPGWKRGWTTHGTPEKRGGGSLGIHRRTREYHADAFVRVVLRLDPAGQAPDLDALAVALLRPARPLFLGRKPCLPAWPLWHPAEGWVKAPTVHAALSALPELTGGEHRALWPVGEGPEDGPGVDKVVALADRRNWQTGLHGGTRLVVEGRIAAAPGRLS
jgi:CRISPR system Cascade subunit CasD